MENKDEDYRKSLKQEKSSSSSSSSSKSKSPPSKKSMYVLDVPPTPSPPVFTMEMDQATPKKRQKKSKSPETNFEKYKKYQKRGYTTEAELEKYYPPFEPEFYKTLPFEQDIKNILGEEYMDTLSVLVDAADKTNYAYWNYKMYISRDMGFSDFDTTIADAPEVIEYIYYLYLRFGDPSQYHDKSKEGKYNVIKSIIELEIDDEDETDFEINFEDDYTFDQKIEATLKDYGNLVIDTPNVNMKDIDKYRFIQVKLEKDEETIVPKESDLEDLGFPNDLLLMLQRTKFKLSRFIYKLLSFYNEKYSIISIGLNTFYVPDNTIDDLLKNFSTRFAVIPLTLPGHQNLIIVDSLFQTIERFEPHGKQSFNRLFKLYLTNAEFNQYISKQGLKDFMLKVIQNNYDISPYYKSNEIKKLIDAIIEYSKFKPKYEKFFKLIAEFLMADYKLANLNWDNHLPGYTYLSPAQYQAEIGPQSYFDYASDIPMPLGLCVAFCFVYLMLRMNCQTKTDFINLQANINSDFFKFLYDWYVKFVDPSIDFDKTAQDHNIFVKSAIVEFIVTANDKYYKVLFDDINDLFKTSFISAGGRKFFA